MNRTAILTAAAALLAAPGVVAADTPDDDYMDAYWADRICYVGTAEGATIAVLDTFDLVPHWTVGTGTTSAHLMLCQPWACPDPYIMVSATCSLVDPFDHLPAIDAPATAGAVADRVDRHQQATFGVDVGPLIEPPIAETTS